jgi:hypothetical protein
VCCIGLLVICCYFVFSQADDNLEAAASFLIREWAQKLLGQPFCSLRELACHLVDKMCVDGRSVAAFALLSATSESGSKYVSPPPVPTLASQSSTKPRDAQLNRKFQEKELHKEQKRKIQQVRNIILLTFSFFTLKLCTRVVFVVVVL